MPHSSRATLNKKMKSSIKGFFSKCDHVISKCDPQLPADLVTFSEEILNGKLHFLCCTSNGGNEG